MHLEEKLGLKKALSPLTYLLPAADVSHGTFRGLYLRGWIELAMDVTPCVRSRHYLW